MRIFLDLRTLSQEKTNNMDFDVIIGLELHIQMKTKSKLFSSAPVTFGKEPNTQVNIIDLGYPGVMPTVNKQAVINATRLCNALHMHIDDSLQFERKNYYYSDLPRGYQITQQFRPLGTNGYLDINGRKIEIERLHIEEDTCKQIHIGDKTLLDYNRAGIPLVEIVTKPVIRNGEEASKFVEKMRSIVSFLDVSDGKMERGSLRCDVNISLKEKGSNKFGTKVEIKNLNSISNIQKAVDYEILRQSGLLENGQNIKQESRRFDEASKKTTLLREKTDDVDYRYFTEPNIVPIKLSSDFIDSAIKSSPELADSKYKRYLKLGLTEYDSNILVSDPDLAKYFDAGIELGVNPKLFANWIIDNVRSILHKKEISISEFGITPSRLVELVNLIEAGSINSKQAKNLFIKIINNDISIEELMKQNDNTQLNNKDEIIKIINEIIETNPQLVVEYNNGKTNIIKFVVGQVLKETSGKANPALTNKLVIEELQRR